MSGQKPIRPAGAEIPAVPATARGIDGLGGRGWLLIVALAVLVILSYRSVWNAGFIWDDNDYVTNNTTLRSLEGLRRIWFELGATPQYYPVTHTSFWVEYHRWRLNPRGYHVVNVSLHALNAILVWLILRRLGVAAAWWIAAVFAVHPVCVESVAWVTERKNVLSGLLYLGALLAYLRFDNGFQGSDLWRKRWRFYWLALVLYGCALLSKSVTCSLPVVIVLLLWWKRGRLGWRDVGPLVPLLAAGVAMGLTTAWMEKHRVGAVGEAWTLSFVERCLIAGRAFWFYIGKLVWPRNLVFMYPKWQVNPSWWWQYLFPLGAVAAVAGLWTTRNRWGRGPLVALLFFVVTLGPALGFVNIFPFRYSFVADHFQYLASLGVIALLVSSIAAPFRRWPGWNTAGALMSVAVLVTLTDLSWRQGWMYHDIETLYRTTIRQNPDSWWAHNNLGLVLSRAGKIQEAIEQYEQALRVDPDLAETHNNLGNALAQAGQIKDAIRHYEQALRINPRFFEAHSNWGNVLLRAGRIQDSIGHCEQALRINPDYAEAHNNLGNALAQAGDIGGAIAQFEQAARINPDLAVVHYNLGNALFQAGKVGDAIHEYGEALRINPHYAEAHNNWGTVLFRTGKIQEAIGHYEQALRINPGYAEAQRNLTQAQSPQ